MKEGTNLLDWLNSFVPQFAVAICKDEKYIIEPYSNFGLSKEKPHSENWNN